VRCHGESLKANTASTSKKNDSEDEDGYWFFLPQLCKIKGNYSIHWPLYCLKITTSQCGGEWWLWWHDNVHLIELWEKIRTRKYHSRQSTETLTVKIPATNTWSFINYICLEEANQWHKINLYLKQMIKTASDCIQLNQIKLIQIIMFKKYIV